MWFIIAVAQRDEKFIFEQYILTIYGIEFIGGTCVPFFTGGEGKSMERTNW